jgi:hypothetical protein
MDLGTLSSLVVKLTAAGANANAAPGPQTCAFTSTDDEILKAAAGPAMARYENGYQTVHPPLQLQFWEAIAHLSEGDRPSSQNPVCKAQ